MVEGVLGGEAEKTKSEKRKRDREIESGRRREANNELFLK